MYYCGTYLHMLCIKANLLICITTCIPTATHIGVTFWECLNTTWNFSLSFVSAQSYSMMSNAANTITISLKISDERSSIDSEDINRLTEQKTYIPTTITNLKHLLNHGIHILSITFRNKSFIISQLVDYQTHIQKNCKLLCQDNLFAARVFHVIDIRIQHFFKDAQGKCYTTSLDVNNMQEDII